jgi:cytochrome c oxidase subunit 2
LKRKVLRVDRSLALPVAIIIFFFLAGCNGPLSALSPAGPSAHAIAGLWWGMFGFSALILLAVVALWLYAMWRKPQPLIDADEAERINLRWIIGGGLVLPVASLTVLLAYGIPMGYRMLPLPLAGQTPLRIEVTGHRWWWEVRYPGTDIVLKNELHLPAGSPVDMHVTSADVIHSFWIPRLAGKLDMIPGRTNVLRLQADAPGRFRGECAEFCGVGHAGMTLAVQAHTPQDFQAWLEARKNE